MFERLGRAVLLACVSLAVGCAHGVPRPSAASASLGPTPPMLLAAPAGARVAVRVAPRELLQPPGAVALWEAFVDPAKERAFAERTGIDPRALFELVFVELPLPRGAFMMVLRGPFDAEAAVREAGERLAHVDVSADSPYLRREGLRGEGRWAYVALAPDTFVVAKDASPSAFGGFLKRLTGAEPSQLEAEARVLAAAHARDVLTVLVPTPLDMPGSSGAAVLLSRERALSFSLQPRDDAFDLTLELRGEFPTTAEDNFRTLITSIASTQLGRDLGLAAALGTLQVTHTPERGRVELGLTVPAEDLVRGLRVLFDEELSGVFE